MNPFDVLRGFYVRSPRMVHELAKPFLAFLPTGIKFGGTYADCRARIARAAHDPQFAQKQHLAALQALIAKAHRGSPFYRRSIDAVFGTDFAPSAFTLADLRRLPVLTKGQLTAAGETALAVPRWQVDRAKTNGSNAECPFSFFLDKDRSAREMAFIYDAWSRIGFSESDARVSLRGFHLKNGVPSNQSWDPALRELQLAVFPMTPEHVKAYIDEIDRRGIRYLYGYPSAIELLCRRMRQIGRTPRAGIKGILAISEPLYEHQRALIRDVLGDVRFSVFYGLSEKVAFAIELAGDNDLYEFNPLYGVTELLDENDDPVTTPGQEGRIVATGFLSTGMPFIRYDTGDFASLVDIPTPENGQRLRVRSLAPRRKPDFLISSEGQRIVMTNFTPEDPRLYDGIAEIQLYQDTPGDVVIRYILDREGTHADIERFRSYVHEKARQSFTFRLEAASQLAIGRNGKRAFIDQRLDVMRY